MVFRGAWGVTASTLLSRPGLVTRPARSSAGRGASRRLRGENDSPAFSVEVVFRGAWGVTASTLYCPTYLRIIYTVFRGAWGVTASTPLASQVLERHWGCLPRGVGRHGVYAGVRPSHRPLGTGVFRGAWGRHGVYALKREEGGGRHQRSLPRGVGRHGVYAVRGKRGGNQCFQSSAGRGASRRLRDSANFLPPLRPRVFRGAWGVTASTRTTRL